MRKIAAGSTAIFILFLLWAGKLSGAPDADALEKALPLFDGWKKEFPFTQADEGFVTVGADYTKDDRSFQFMVITGPEAPSAGPLPEELEEDRASGRAESDIAVFSFFTLDNFPAVKVEMKDESGATVWVDLAGKGWLLLGGDGMSGDEILSLLRSLDLGAFASMAGQP